MHQVDIVVNVDLIFLSFKRKDRKIDFSNWPNTLEKKGSQKVSNRLILCNEIFIELCILSSS